MPQKTMKNIEKIEQKAEVFIKKVREASSKSAETLGKEYRLLISDIKETSDKIDRAIKTTEETSKKTWRELAERTRKTKRKIEREWTSVVKEPREPPADP